MSSTVNASKKEIPLTFYRACITACFEKREGQGNMNILQSNNRNIIRVIIMLSIREANNISASIQGYEINVIVQNIFNTFSVKI